MAGGRLAEAKESESAVCRRLSAGLGRQCEARVRRSLSPLFSSEEETPMEEAGIFVYSFCGKRLALGVFFFHLNTLFYYSKMFIGIQFKSGGFISHKWRPKSRPKVCLARLCASRLVPRPSKMKVHC